MRIRATTYSGYDANNPSMVNVTAQNNCRGFRIQDTTGIYIKDCTAENNTDNSFYFASGSYTSAAGCHGSTFDSCTAINSGQTGFMNIGGDDNYFVNCVIDGSRGAGFYNYNSNGNIYFTGGTLTNANTFETTTPWGGATDDANGAAIGMSVQSGDTNAVLTISQTHVESGDGDIVFYNSGPGEIILGPGNTFNMANFPGGLGMPTSAPTASPISPGSYVIIEQLPVSDVSGAIHNNPEMQLYDSHNPSNFIMKIEQQIDDTTGLPISSTFQVGLKYNCISDAPATTSFVLQGNGLGLPPIELSDVSWEEVQTWTTCGETKNVLFTVVGDNVESIFGMFVLNDKSFRIQIQNSVSIDDASYLSSNYLKTIQFNPVSLDSSATSLSFALDVQSAYYASSADTPRTLTVVNLGQCNNVMTSAIPNCGNIPVGWGATYSTLFNQTEPSIYNPSELTNNAWKRYPDVPGTWVTGVQPVTHIGGLAVDGIQYHFEGELEDMVNTCIQGGEHVVDIEHADDTAHYHFNVSLLLVTPYMKGYYTPPSSGAMYNEECRTQPYTISVSQSLEAVIAHESSLGLSMYVQSVSYEECSSCVDSIYTCTPLHTSYRLSIDLAVDIPLTSDGLYEGFVTPQDVTSPGTSSTCFGFPKTSETTWTAVEMNGRVHTVLTMKTECFSIWNNTVQDCARFNTCSEQGVINKDQTDYSLHFNLKQCANIDCLSSGNTCTNNDCSDHPPDELLVGIDIRLHECPGDQTIETTVEIDPEAHIRAYPGKDHPTDGVYAPLNSPSYGSHEYAVFSLETDNEFLENRMTTWLKEMFICHVLSTASYKDCVTMGTSCPEGMTQGCQKQQWEIYCATHGCTVPIDNEYPLVLDFKSYEYYQDYFNTRLCKNNGTTTPNFCVDTGTCTWDISNGKQNSFDAVEFSCMYLPQEGEDSSTWIIDMTGIMWDCHTQTRSIVHKQEKLSRSMGGFSIRSEEPTVEAPAPVPPPAPVVFTTYGVLAFNMCCFIVVAGFMYIMMRPEKMHAPVRSDSVRVPPHFMWEKNN